MTGTVGMFTKPAPEPLVVLGPERQDAGRRRRWNRRDDIGPRAGQEEDLALGEFRVPGVLGAAFEDRVVQQAAFAADPVKRDEVSVGVGQLQAHDTGSSAALTICRRSPCPGCTSSVEAPAARAPGT